MSRTFEQRLVLAATLILYGCSQAAGGGGQPGNAGRGGAGTTGSGAAAGGGAGTTQNGGAGGTGNGGAAGGSGAGGRAGSAGAAGNGGAAGGSGAGGRAGSGGTGKGGSSAGGSSAGTGGAAAPIAFNPPTCGKPLAGFQGALCGPSSVPCRKLADEMLDPAWGDSAIATDAQGRPHLMFSDVALTGYYTVRDSSGWSTPEVVPTKTFSGLLVVGADGFPVALVESGSLPGTSLWKRDASGWRRLDGADLNGYESYATGNLVATQDGCYHASLVGNQAEPAYGLWNGHWNLTSLGLSQQGNLAPGVALAADGTAQVAAWKYGADAMGTVDWAARGGSLEPVDGLVGYGSTTPAFITVVGAAGQAPTPYVFYRALSGSTATFPYPSNLVLAWRSPNGTWSHQTMATSSGTSIVDCGAATMTSPPCNIDNTETAPLGITSSGNGDVRVFFRSTHHKETLVSMCTAFAPQSCSWLGTPAPDGGVTGNDPPTFQMGWKNADGSVGQTVLVTTVANSIGPSFAVDVQGRIHVVTFQGSTTSPTARYMLFGP